MCRSYTTVLVIFFIVFTLYSLQIMETVQCKRSFIFDHLWGIPGETGDREVAMLQDICRRQGEVRKMCFKCVIIYLVMHR